MSPHAFSVFADGFEGRRRLVFFVTACEVGRVFFALPEGQPRAPSLIVGGGGGGFLAAVVLDSVSSEVVGPGEGLAAVGALVGPLAVVHPNVLGQLRGHAEGPAALGTAEALLPGVDLLVPLQGGGAREGLATLRAREGPLAGVDALVARQARGLREGHAAVGALEGPLAGVQRLMLQQVGGFGEALAAGGAGEGFEGDGQRESLCFCLSWLKVNFQWEIRGQKEPQEPSYLCRSLTALGSILKSSYVLCTAPHRPVSPATFPEFYSPLPSISGRAVAFCVI